MTDSMLWSLLRDGSWAIAGATAGACFCCLAKSPETTLFGIFIAPFLALSIVPFLLLQSTCSSSLPKYLGFFVPAILIGMVCLYETWSLRSQVMLEGISDGGDQMVAGFLQCYGVGLIFAFLLLLLTRHWRTKR